MYHTNVYSLLIKNWNSVKFSEDVATAFVYSLLIKNWNTEVEKAQVRYNGL